MEEKLSDFSTLVNIMARLRATGGCPWDRKQTHASLRENLLEETYEVLEALDEGNARELCQELGDLLMQIVFHAQIAAESGDFTIGDVVQSINAKLKHRHPHIFGSATAKDAEDVAHNWEALKRAEREAGTSILAGVPKSMPALGYSHAIQRRAAQVGFDWKDVDGVIDKVAEEVRELKSAPDQAAKFREFGDLVFTLVNFARRTGIDSESALREANRRFQRRFRCMEELSHERGLQLDKLSLDELDALWEEAKREA